MTRLRDIAVDVTPLRISADFRRLFVGLTLSGVGSRVTDIAIPIQIYRLTHSTFAVGLLGLVTLVPRFSLSIYGGALADRARDRRVVLVACELAGGLCAAALAINAWASHPRLWIVYLLAFASSSAGAVAVPASRSAVPLLIGVERLAAAMALKAMVLSTAWLIGPALAGLLTAVGGSKLAYLFDAATFLMALMAFLSIRPIPPVVQPDDETTTLTSIVEGFRLLRRRIPVVGSFLMDVDAMAFGLPVALFPAVVDQRFHNSSVALALLYGAPFAGSMVASAASGWTKRIDGHGIALTICVVAWGAFVTGFAFAPGLISTLVCLSAAGAADMISGIFRQLILNTATPPEMFGRMEGVGMAVWTTGPALGDLEAGTVASLTNVTTSIWTGGVACMLGAVVLSIALPEFRRYRTSIAIGATTP